MSRDRVVIFRDLFQNKMDEVLKELGLIKVRTEHLSDEEQSAFLELCGKYAQARTELDRNDYKRKIRQLIINIASKE